MLRVPTDKRTERRRVLLHDQRDLGVLERHALLHSGEQIPHGGSWQSRLVAAAGNDADPIAAGEMHVQRMKRRGREVEAENPADLEDVDNAGEAARIAGQTVEGAAVHAVIDVV